MRVCMCEKRIVVSGTVDHLVLWIQVALETCLLLLLDLELRDRYIWQVWRCLSGIKQPYVFKKRETDLNNEMSITVNRET